ncbi:MAG: prepilin-type N-terminal cleavage/methylation domain-containing protein [Desulfuromonadaceae bacterium]
MTTSSRNNYGFTLIEVMIAIVIMMVGMLGLLQSINIAMEYNLKNHLRDEAVYVGEKYMNIQRGKVFDLLSTTYGTRYEPSKIRGTGKPYSVVMSTQDLSTDARTPAKQLTIEVKWTYKGVEYVNMVKSPVSVIK